MKSRRKKQASSQQYVASHSKTRPPAAVLESVGAGEKPSAGRLGSATRTVDWRYVYALILVPWVIYSIIYTARAVHWNYTPVPAWDYWREVAHLGALTHFDPRHFWMQHNEHRIIFPELFFALDYLWFHGRQLLPIGASCLLQVAHTAVLCWILWTAADLPVAFRLCGTVAITAFMASSVQISDLASAFTVVWYVAHLSATLSLLFLWRAALPGCRRSDFVLSLITATVGTYSTANGLVLWPILVMLAICARFPARRVITLAITGSAAIGAYFIGYTMPQTNGMHVGSGMHIIAAHPLQTLGFIARYVSAPVSYRHYIAGSIIGIAGFVLAVGVLAQGVRRPGSRGPVFFVGAGNCLFVVGSGLLTAIGRMDPRDPTLAAATMSRYAVSSLLYLACVTIMLMWLAAQWRGRFHMTAHLVCAALIVVILWAVMPEQGRAEQAFARMQATFNEAGLALVAGVRDPEIDRILFIDPEVVSALAPELQKRRLSIYASGQDLMGKTIKSVFGSPVPDVCTGASLSAAPVRGGVMLSGWAFDMLRKRPPHQIVLAAAGSIIGLGETWHSGYPAIAGLYAGPAANEWVGFAAGAATGPIQAYAVLDGHVACPLGEPVEAIPEVMATKAGWSLRDDGYLASGWNVAQQGFGAWSANTVAVLKYRPPSKSAQSIRLALMSVAGKTPVPFSLVFDTGQVDGVVPARPTPRIETFTVRLPVGSGTGIHTISLLTRQLIAPVDQGYNAGRQKIGIGIQALSADNCAPSGTIDFRPAKVQDSACPN